MAGNNLNLYMLEGIQKLEQYEQGSFIREPIIDVFAVALLNPTPEALVDAAAHFDEMLPPIEDKADVDEYLWNLWEVMVSIAESPSVPDEIQGYLVNILEFLQQYAKGDPGGPNSRQRVWQDLPHFSINVEDSFLDPVDFENYSPEYLQEWRNTNRFLARLVEAGIFAPSSQVMYAMRVALEEDLSMTDNAALRECRVQIACDWIKHTAKPLLWWALENLGYHDVPVEDEAAYVEGGPLYYGPQTMCLRRWGFWMDRFQQLGDPNSSSLREEVREAALETVYYMNRVERGLGHTLSEQGSRNRENHSS
ncbi:hypothetical protein PG987_010086 [Apiospora arundinis]